MMQKFYSDYYFFPIKIFNHPHDHMVKIVIYNPFWLINFSRGSYYRMQEAICFFFEKKNHDNIYEQC